MRGVRNLYSTMTILTMLQITTEKAITSSPNANVGDFVEEDMDPDSMTEDYIFSHRGTTMLPRYLQLGNQTVDLNKLFKVPQENDENIRVHSHGGRIQKSRDEDLKTEVANGHRHSGGSHDGHSGHTGSSHSVSGHAHSGLSGHSGSVHSQLDQMPWLRQRPQHEHDRRHGPHFEDASADNSTVTVQAGHTAHFDCKVSMLRDKTVSWVKRRTGEPPLLLTVGDQTYTGDVRFAVLFRYPGNWRLKLTAVNKSDEGLYECQLSTHPPSVIRVYLKVEAPEVSIVDEAGLPLREQYYEAGSTLHLRCVVRGGPTTGAAVATVWWLHGARELHRDATRGGVAVRTEAARRGSAESSLRVSKLGPADAGNYTCVLPPTKAYTVLVHVLNESLAELQQGSSTSGPPTFLIFFSAILFILGACS